MVAKFKKLSDIKKIIDDFYTTIKTCPLSFGSVEDIEANFFIIDHIDLIINYQQIEYDELSWQSFLFYKGFGNTTATSIIKNNASDHYKELNNLREEYVLWRNAKLESLNNSENNMLLDILASADYNKAKRLTTWFIKHPSTKAVKLYKNMIDYNYAESETISLFISCMGDYEIIKWATEVVNHNKTSNRDISLKILAASPLDEADIMVKQIIKSNIIDDIVSIVRGYACSTNKHCFKRLSNISKLYRHKDILKTELLVTLRSQMHCKNKIATKIYQRLTDES